MDNQWKYAGIAGASVLLTLAAAGMAQTTGNGLGRGFGPGLGRFGRVDANGDGAVTRAEWIAAATTRFDRLDANHDGKLVAGERPRRGPRRGRGHRHGRDAFDGRMHSGYDDGQTGPPPPVPGDAATPR